MARKLPPLKAVNTFEVAARHLSFTEAAKELFVTQAAVSHQIKALEAFLGVRLFRRAHRKLLLTEAGQEYLQAVRPMLDGIGEATERLLQRKASGALTVSMTPSFAIAWLVPRLSDFSALHPEIDVRIKAVDREQGILDEDTDVGFFYGRGRWSGMKSLKLHSEYRIPVCSPALLERGIRLEKPDDLQHVNLLHDGNRKDWKSWLRSAGARRISAEQGPVFSHSTMALQAAVLGQGVALGHTTLAKPDLDAGRLICPFKTALLSRDAYYLVYPENQGQDGRIKAFRDWVSERVRAETAETVLPAQRY